MLRLDKRLTAVVNAIHGKSVADIGTDHGKVVVSALLQKKVERAIAVDISEKSLEKAKFTANEYCVQDKVSFVCCDGLSKLPYQPDCIVIAGMGGYEIVNILEKYDGKARLVLVPHQDSRVVRNFAMERKLKVEADFILKSGKKFYSLIVCDKDGDEYTSKELFFGKNNPPTKDREEFVNHRREILTKIINGLGDGSNVSSHIKEELKEINDVCI